MSGPRLSESALGGLPADVVQPGYNRTTVKAGVVHLGIGAFHRAHQADVFDQLIRAGDPRWGIRGASLRSPDVAEQMNPQDGLYSVVVRDGSSEQVRIIGAVQDVLVAPQDPAALVEALAAADTHLVTLTVTEKGYKLDPATGTLLTEDADVAADLGGLDRPKTAPGFLVAALKLRRERGLPALTAISCDNLPHNGAALSAAVLDMAARHDPALRDWIEANGAFPQTMVDRIVPATTSEDIDALAARLGVVDRAMVKTEPFTQWVVEDRFAGERPDLASAGVQLTQSVAPWEEAKLRLLNGAHSAIAYLGGLAGIDFVHQFVAREAGSRFVNRVWDEAETTLSPPPGLEVAAYRNELMARFANSSLQHRTRQIAMDGSQKLPQRLLATISARLQKGQPIDALALGVAAWMRWQEGRDEGGAAFKVDDPLADTTRSLVERGSSPTDKALALLSLSAVFPADLVGRPDFRAAVTTQAERLARLGALGAIDALLSGNVGVDGSGS
ncbi:mannitol dehydrogenase family protein [Phenylobacterium deserti]|uniref:Mannitol dehydrogenase family protein n=1 Tax=Phenylobacterium deserti TaxID=1914756 RepID=A0A328AEX6_9CAUL|nr:mannitol dehydrogenase family protein [Phenylobacterium deserti]RAK51338.1 mannitol dehydrogenase family protein [Phenylobacterium deserti]